MPVWVEVEGMQARRGSGRQIEGQAGMHTEALRQRWEPKSWETGSQTEGECVNRSRQVEAGMRSHMQAMIDAGMWAGQRRWLAVARPKREAGREERGCWQGRGDKQTEAVLQEEACSHLEPEAGRWGEADMRYRQARKRAAMQTKAQKQEDAEVGRQKWAGRQECRQMSREGIR
jgi:hypothetical protein